MKEMKTMIYHKRQGKMATQKRSLIPHSFIFILYFSFFISQLAFLTACNSSDGEDQQKPTMLTIYVFSPEQPIITRGDVGPVNASEAENKVNSLQLWIFDTSGNKVGYLNTTETATLNTGQGAIYQIPVSDEFAQNKPNVDVYVLANVTAANCGISTTLDENTTREALIEQAKITSGHFGLTSASLATAVPADGLPMAGILKNQPVIGDAPVLRIGNETNIATVPLTRAVSKMRFFFANVATAPKLTITGITLNGSLIPNEEYLFTQSKTLTYNENAASILASSIEVAQTEDPAQYVYEGQTAQEYENLMVGAELSLAGPYYLRESGKILTGTITYTVEGMSEPMSATFTMKEQGDFLRNHSWIVYAYYEGLSGMQVVTVDVTDWVAKSYNYEVYNW
jgi:hypothetical protein